MNQPQPAASTDALSAGIESVPSTAPRRRDASQWFGALAILVIALSVRLVSFLDIKDSPLLENRVFLADARYYDQRARRIAAGDVWGDEVFFMAPLYEYALGVCYSALGDSADAAIHVQCVVGALTCSLLFLLGRRLFGPAAGWFAGAAAALYGPLILFDGLMMATSIILLTGVAALWLLLRADRIATWSSWLLAGVGVGVASIAHGSMLGVAILVAVALVCDVRRRGRRVWLGNLAGFLAGTALTILPVTVRNYVVGHDLVLLTSNAGMNFFIGNNETATGTHVIYQFPFRLTSLRDYYNEPPRHADEPAPSEVSRRVAGQAFRWIREHPADAARLWVKKLALFFNAVELGINDDYHFFRQFSVVLRRPVLNFGVIAPLGLTGAVFLSKRFRALRMLYLVLAAQTVVFVTIFVLGRYRFVAAACLMLLAGGLVGWWIDQVRARRWRPIALSLATLTAFAIAVNVTLPGYEKERGHGKLYSSLGAAYLQLARQERDPAKAKLALAALQRAAASPWTEGGITASRSLMLVRLGDAYFMTGDVESAKAIWQEARAEIERESSLTPEDYQPVCPHPASIQDLEARLRQADELAGRTMP